MTKLTELKYELLPHRPYSSDLAPSDYYLFTNLKRWLVGKRFYWNEEVIAGTNAYSEELSANYYKRGIELLETRWNKCIELEGNYVEEQMRMFSKKCYSITHARDFLNDL